MATMSEQSTDWRPVHERIAVDLRDGILSGALPPGSLLSETELQGRFAVAGAAVAQGP